MVQDASTRFGMIQPAQFNMGAENDDYPQSTVDGRNSAPVDMVNIPLVTGFCTYQLVQDFFHQQYLFFEVPCSVSCFFPSAVWGEFFNLTSEISSFLEDGAHN